MNFFVRTASFRSLSQSIALCADQNYVIVCVCVITLLPSRLQTLEHKTNGSLHISPSYLCTCCFLLSFSLSLSLVQPPATQDLAELTPSPRKPKHAKRTKPSPSGKKVAARSKSPKKSSLQEKFEGVANGEVSTDTSPAKKSTARKRKSPGGKRVGKSKPKLSAQRRQLASDDEPDDNSDELQIPQVAYPPELGYCDPECLERVILRVRARRRNVSPGKWHR